jgi:hypothetical protein
MLMPMSESGAAVLSSRSRIGPERSRLKTSRHLIFIDIDAGASTPNAAH